MKIAVVGATGLVGGEILKVLAERNFPVTELIPVASEKSVGKTIEFKGKSYKVHSVEDAIKAKPAIAIFSAGGSTSLALAPRFAEAGTTVIDNSSAWRMNPANKPRIDQRRQNHRQSQLLHDSDGGGFKPFAQKIRPEAGGRFYLPIRHWYRQSGCGPADE
jgi:N-acetyl-gamma-glutamylphosphate reductase